MYRKSQLLPLLVALLFAGACAADQPVQEASEAPEPAASVDPGPEQVPAFESLIGTWVSETDAKEEVTFTQSSYRTVYDGQPVIEENMDLYADCPSFCLHGDNAQAGMPCFVVTGEYDATCYHIVSVNNEVLEITLIGGRGNTLRYRRKS